MSGPTRKCSTLGCGKRPATHTLTYSFPESRDNPETDVVCKTCGDGYVRRPSLKATLVTTRPLRLRDEILSGTEEV